MRRPENPRARRPRHTYVIRETDLTDTTVQLTLYHESKPVGMLVLVYDLLSAHERFQRTRAGIVSQESGVITQLRVDEAHRGRGFGTRLLRRAICIARDMRLWSMRLDDMSDRQHKSNNIYRKAGFVYLDDHLPEMMLLL